MNCRVLKGCVCVCVCIINPSSGLQTTQNTGNRNIHNSIETSTVITILCTKHIYIYKTQWNTNISNFLSSLEYLSKNTSQQHLPTPTPGVKTCPSWSSLSPQSSCWNTAGGPPPLAMPSRKSSTSKRGNGPTVTGYTPNVSWKGRKFSWSELGSWFYELVLPENLG